MKVILNTDIANLGEEGDVLNVSPGYARNYLLPKGLVSMYNKTNLAILDDKKKAIEKRREEKRQNALSLKEKIKNANIEFAMPAGDNGKLFGAVTAQMIVDGLEKNGMTIERKKVEIPGHTLKALGNYKVHIRLYGDEEADLVVAIVRDDSTPGKETAKPAASAAPAPKTEDPAEVAVQAEAAEEAVEETPVAEAAAEAEAEENTEV